MAGNRYAKAYLSDPIDAKELAPQMERLEPSWNQLEPS